MHKKKHYPLMPGKESPHTIMVRIPMYEYEALKAELAALKESQRWRKYTDEKPDVKAGEGDDFLVVVDCYNTYNLKSPRGRYVTEATYSVDEDEKGCFYRAYSDQEIDETFEGKDGEECFVKVIMWRPMPKAPEADKFK